LGDLDSDSPLKKQDCFIRSGHDFVKSMSKEFRKVGKRKTTTSRDRFNCVGKALPKASPFSCPIRFFSRLIFLLETLANQLLLGNETALP
jgi:hypothetical protein